MPDTQCLQIYFSQYNATMIVHILKISIVAKGCILSLYALKFIGVGNCNTVPSNRSIFQFRFDQSKIQHQ
jgi:hypothetical protein